MEIKSCKTAEGAQLAGGYLAAFFIEEEKGMEEVKDMDCLCKLSQVLKEAKAELQKIGFDLMWEFTIREYHELVCRRLDIPNAPEIPVSQLNKDSQ